MLKRILAGAALVVAAGTVGAGAWWYHERNEPPPEKRGSATVEFVPAEEPAKVKRRRAEQKLEPWPTYGLDERRSSVASEFPHRPPFRRLWTVRTGNFIEFPPSIAYRRVYIAQQRGRFLTVSATNGRVIWQKNFKRCAASSPTVGNGIVYQAYMHPKPCPKHQPGADGFVVAMRASNGRTLWRFKTAPVESSPLLVGSTLYFGSWDSKVYALHARTKKVLWTYRTDDRVNTSPAYADGTIYVGTNGGRVYAIYARTGKLRWRAESLGRFGGREYFYASPTIAYGRVYIGNTDGNVYAYGASSGKLLWAKNAGSYVYSKPAVWNRLVIVGSYDGNVYAFDAATGDLRWKRELTSAVHGAPTVMGGLVYVSACGRCGSSGSRSAKSGPRGTFALDARNGKEVWRFFDGQYSPVVADPTRVYLTGQTRVYGLLPRGKKARTTASR